MEHLFQPPSRQTPSGFLSFPPVSHHPSTVDRVLTLLYPRVRVPCDTKGTYHDRQDRTGSKTGQDQDTSPTRNQRLDRRLSPVLEGSTSEFRVGPEPGQDLSSSTERERDSTRSTTVRASVSEDDTEHPIRLGIHRLDPSEENVLPQRLGSIPLTDFNVSHILSSPTWIPRN